MGSIAQYNLVISWELLCKCYLWRIYSYYGINVNFKVIVFKSTSTLRISNASSNNRRRPSCCGRCSRSSQIPLSLFFIIIADVVTQHLHIPSTFEMVGVRRMCTENRILIFLRFLLWFVVRRSNSTLLHCVFRCWKWHPFARFRIENKHECCIHSVFAIHALCECGMLWLLAGWLNEQDWK